MQFRCDRCGETVSVLDDTQSLRCENCGAELIVQRSQGTIALKVTPERDINEATRFVPELIDKLTAEVTEFNAELAKIRRRRIIITAVGGCCGLIFAAFGIHAWWSNDSHIGLGMLLCA